MMVCCKSGLGFFPKDFVEGTLIAFAQSSTLNITTYNQRLSLKADLAQRFI